VLGFEVQEPVDCSQCIEPASDIQGQRNRLG
jgi:hypothetical protein